MPGSMFELECRGCQAVHEMSTGAGWCDEHSQGWEYRQRVCTSCQLFASEPAGCHFQPKPCDRCGGGRVTWVGRVFFERTDETSPGIERVEGPCPRCGTTLGESDSAMLGLWD